MENCSGPPVTKRGSMLRSMWALWVHLYQSQIHALCKVFILCHCPRRMVPHSTEFAIQSVLYLGNRCNRPCYAAVIPMTLCSLPFYHRSPLYTRHIKCSNTQREIPWHKYALTHTFSHLHFPTHTTAFIFPCLTHTYTDEEKGAILCINDKYNRIFFARHIQYVPGACEDCHCKTKISLMNKLFLWWNVFIKAHKNKRTAMTWGPLQADYFYSFIL